MCAHNVNKALNEAEYIQILSRAVTYLHGAYNIPAVRFGGHACCTNLPSNTAIR